MDLYAAIAFAIAAGNMEKIRFREMKNGILIGLLRILAEQRTAKIGSRAIEMLMHAEQQSVVWQWKWYIWSE